MNQAERIIRIISGLGFISFIVGISLLGRQYDLAWFICTFLGALVLLVGLVLIFTIHLLKRRGEPKVRYGRYHAKDNSSSIGKL
jgi:uncharacterized membrane protein HdeD (DUF308 family)